MAAGAPGHTGVTPPRASQSCTSQLAFSTHTQTFTDHRLQEAVALEWDTAAGQARLESVGGCVLGMDGKALRYNEGASLLSPDYYAIADGDAPFWQGLFVHSKS